MFNLVENMDLVTQSSSICISRAKEKTDKEKERERARIREQKQLLHHTMDGRDLTYINQWRHSENVRIFFSF